MDITIRLGKWVIYADAVHEAAHEDGRCRDAAGATDGGSLGRRQVIAMGLSASQMVATAKAQIENLSPDQVAAAIGSGAATLIDLREEDERRATGVLPGAHHAPRGMLEFYADPSSPYHREEFDPEARIILMCAFGGRSALAAETLQRMGFGRVAHLDGGIKAWIEQGLPVEQA